MTSAGHDKHIYKLASDKPYRLADMTAEATRQIGKPFHSHNLTQAEHARALAQAGLPQPFIVMVVQVEAQGCPRAFCMQIPRQSAP